MPRASDADYQAPDPDFEYSLLKAVVESTSDAIYIKDVQGKYLMFNQAASGIVGKHADEVVGRDDTAIFPPEEARAVMEGDQGVLAAGVVMTYEEVVTDAGGTTRTYLSTKGPLVDAQGVVTALFGIAHDITDLKNAERALRASNQRLRTYIDSNIVGVILATAWGSVLEANDYYLRLIGYSRDEFENGIVDWRAITPPEWLAADEHALEELSATGRCTPYEKEYVRRDGERVAVYITDAIVPESDGEIAAFILDITARKRAESDLAKHLEHLEELVTTRTQELERANTELDASNEGYRTLNKELTSTNQELDRTNEDLRAATEAKSQFLASMSHELRTPLNSIIGFSEMLFRGMVGDLSEEQHKQIGMIHRSGLHLLALINDILDLSRIEAGAVDLVLEPFDAAEVVLEVAETLGPLATEKGLALAIDVPEIGVTVISDRHKVSQVLLNLGGNALKFTDAGRVDIRLTPLSNEVRFTVSDTGCGIPPAELDHIFEAFSQVDQTDHAKPEGTGLGLAISREFANLLGAQILVESQPGVGSTFTFVLPIA